MPSRRRPRGPSLFEELVFAADRDRIPGARPLVSFGAQDEPEFLDELGRSTRARFELSRRGRYHGELAELDLRTLGLPERHPRVEGRELRARWQGSRPILLPGIAERSGASAPAQLFELFELADALPAPGALAAWLRAREHLLPPGMALQQRRARLADPERDIEKVLLAWQGAGTREVRDLWIKSAWLSTYEQDASLRLRFSFGREVEDDASQSEQRHRLVAQLAEALLPDARALAASLPLAHALESALGEEVYLTQHIAYWNALEGGASFHHDAFGGEGSAGQRGVCFVQLAGRTAWIALSIEDLAARVREFAELLEQGELPWLRDQLFPRPADFEALLGRTRDEGSLVRELALPGCGRLGSLVNRGPEFTSFLADGGHALVLEEGDALLLPNHDLARTAMHSVFCASEQTTFALSMAIRAKRPPPEPEPQLGSWSP